MTTTLICTVGGSHEPVVKAIEHLRPDHVCFVCSDDDPATGSKGSYIQITGKGNIIKASFRDEKPTLPNIPAQAGLREEQFTVLRVQPDSLDDIYHRLTTWIGERDRQAERVIADYTGGTKTMSAALVAAALDEGVDLQLVSGSRSNLLKVESGAEYVSPAAATESRFRRQLARALTAWQRFAYDEAAFMLDKLTPPTGPKLRGQFERAVAVSQALAAWDRFDHEAAREILSRYRPKLGAAWKEWFTILEILLDDKRGEPMRLFDLWRNAQRRADNRRYDDAVARAYRLLEWSAQWILFTKAGIETKDVPKDKIPEDMALTVNRQGKYQAGLYNAWALAAHHCGNTIADFWEKEKETMMDRVQLRNHSILAHGFTPMEEQAWKKMETWIEERLLPLLLSLAREEPYRLRRLPAQLPNFFRGL